MCVLVSYVASMLSFCFYIWYRVVIPTFFPLKQVRYIVLSFSSRCITDFSRIFTSNLGSTLCSILDQTGKLIVLLTLGQTVGKLVLNEDLRVKRWRDTLWASSYAIIIPYDPSPTRETCDIERYNERISHNDLTQWCIAFALIATETLKSLTLDRE